MELRKQDILDKTHYGTNIYAHVLKQYYSSDTVLSISGRECQLTKNPFNQNKQTLKIKIENNCAFHNDIDLENFKGNVFDFAELHYKNQGDELLRSIEASTQQSLSESK